MPGRPEGLIVRPPTLDDLEDLHELVRMPGAMWGTMQMPSTTLERARQRLADSLSDPDAHTFVAELDGKVVGSGALHVGRGKARHAGSVGMMVRDDYVGRGIGRAILGALLDVADNYLGLKRVELEVITDNARAIHLYESVGFRAEGTKASAILRGGEFVDILMMGRVR